MTSLLLLGLMGKCGQKRDMAEGFKVLQVAVDDRNFQEGLITALPRSGLLEPAGARDGAKIAPPLTRAVRQKPLDMYIQMCIY
jgi:hypothetical protein